MAPQYVLTLVHGTWADTKGWVAPGSFLRRELERRLANVAFREFAWTSTNTHAARTEAGTRLAHFLRDGHVQHPDARHVVIAHSHGGNVALYAMRDPAALDVVSGIVTLGTPFLYARRRDPRPYADALSWLMLAIAVLAPFAVFDALHLARLAFIWFFGGIPAMVALKPALTRWVMDTVTLEQGDIAAAYQPPDIDRSKLLVLCARGDEARRWLRTWDVVAKGPFAIGGVLLSAVGVATRVNLPIFIDGLSRHTRRRGLEDMHLFGLDGWSLVVGSVVLCVTWGAVLMCSSVVRWAGYWREPLLANLLVELGTDSVPRRVDGNPYDAHTFDIPWPPAHDRGTHGYVRHTAMCDDAAVVGAIGEWIEGGAR